MYFVIIVLFVGLFLFILCGDLDIIDVLDGFFLVVQCWKGMIEGERKVVCDEVYSILDLVNIDLGFGQILVIGFDYKGMLNVLIDVDFEQLDVVVMIFYVVNVCG